VILVLRALGIGDLATAVPALRALRAHYPDRTLSLAAPQWLAPLVDLVGGIDRLVPTDGLTTPLAPTPRPYRAVNLHGRGPESHRLLRASRPVRLLGYRCPPAGHLDGPQWTADEHEVDRWCRLLRHYGIPVDPTDLSLRRPASDRVPVGVTIVHPGAKAAERRWPPERFALVARRLAASGHRVVVTGSAAERGTAARVVEAAGLPPTALHAGGTDVGDLAALVAYGRLVVSGDTGIGHLATAYGTPSVLLFGPVAPAQWGPPPDRPRHEALWHGPMPRAGANPVHPALAAIEVPEVLAAVSRVLAVARTPAWDTLRTRPPPAAGPSRPGTGPGRTVPGPPRPPGRPADARPPDSR
jgi:ADP-heptose:LPS heptosyltransferase